MIQQEAAKQGLNLKPQELAAAIGAPEPTAIAGLPAANTDPLEKNMAATLKMMDTSN